MAITSQCIVCGRIFDGTNKCPCGSEGNMTDKNNKIDFVSELKKFCDVTSGNSGNRPGLLTIEQQVRLGLVSALIMKNGNFDFSFNGNSLGELVKIVIGTKN